MQDLLTRVPRLRIPQASIQWLAIAALGVALVLAVILMLIAGMRKSDAPTIAALKPSAASESVKLDGRLGEASSRETATAKPEQASASAASPPQAIRIVSWDLSTLPAMAGGRGRDDATRTPWRTSFGSERSTIPDIRYDLKADVVLLQGISDATLLRRFFFPARDWHLVVTRQKLNDIAMKADPASISSGITGVAIRVRDGLRITGREFFPRIGGELDSGSDAALLAGTAVRVLDRGRTVWLASFAVPPSCAETPNPCAARARLAEWQESKRQRGEPLVVGGMLEPQVAEPAGEKLCNRQRLKTDLESSQVPPMQADELAGPGSGCALALDLSK